MRAGGTIKGQEPLQGGVPPWPWFPRGTCLLTWWSPSQDYQESGPDSAATSRHCRKEGRKREKLPLPFASLGCLFWELPEKPLPQPGCLLHPLPKNAGKSHHVLLSPICFAHASILGWDLPSWLNWGSVSQQKGSVTSVRLSVEWCVPEGHLFWRRTYKRVPNRCEGAEMQY